MDKPRTAEILRALNGEPDLDAADAVRSLAQALGLKDNREILSRTNAIQEAVRQLAESLTEEVRKNRPRPIDWGPVRQAVNGIKFPKTDLEPLRKAIESIPTTDLSPVLAAVAASRVDLSPIEGAINDLRAAIQAVPEAPKRQYEMTVNRERGKIKTVDIREV